VWNLNGAYPLYWPWRDPSFISEKKHQNGVMARDVNYSLITQFIIQTANIVNISLVRQLMRL